MSVFLDWSKKIATALQAAKDYCDSAISAAIDAVGAIMLLKGSWDASAGTFPGSVNQKAGWTWIVSVGGTVDGVVFNTNDRLIAIANNASTTVFALNWFKADYTDNVLSVNSLTGAVVISDENLSTTDVVTNNASTTKHGFLSKLSGDSNQFQNGQGNWATPAGIVNAYVKQAFSAQTSVVVNHNFGAQPLVAVIDGAGAVLIPLSITHTTANSFTVTFDTSTTGNILATVGSPQVPNYLSTAGNYTFAESDYFVEATATATVTLPTAVGISGKIAVVINSGAGVVTVDGNGSETINGDLTRLLNNKTALTLVSTGSNWKISAWYYDPTGWDDLIPEKGDDATNPFVYGAIGATGRYADGAVGSGGGASIRRKIFDYHPKHAIVIAPATGFIHPHWETTDNAAGNIVLTAHCYAAPPNGAWSIDYPVTITLTPSTALSAGKHIITDVALPAQILAMIEPDARIQMVLERDHAAVADTYTGTFYLHGFDCHLQHTGKLTTSKDKSTGWVQV